MQRKKTSERPIGWKRALDTQSTNERQGDAEKWDCLSIPPANNSSVGKILQVLHYALLRDTLVSSIGDLYPLKFPGHTVGPE